ncbi:C-type lectin 37Db-like [Cylas formicarius]|uniref:C-type lectin 37Db-like n=1 Tax=Cylas formicarius TaxID=197179 RepID=UPI0029586DFD|nr:C-type lectin 37Db-like [Cylas formicarius]
MCTAFASAFSLLVVILVFDSTECQSLTAENIKYVVSQDKQNWIQALINCKSSGMELATVNSEEEHLAMEKFLKDSGHDLGYWLGGTKLGDGTYYWAPTGAKVVFTKWFVGQPDNGGLDLPPEDCIQWGMPSYSPKPTGWNDLNCNRSIQYICQTVDYCYAPNVV